MDAIEWEESPTFSKLFCAIKDYLKTRFEKNEFINTTPVIQYIYNISLVDIFFVILFSFGWSYLRKLLTEKYFKPLGRHYALTPFNQSKMPESAWKFLYNLTAWIVNSYILILSGDYEFFQKPSTIFTGWSLTEPLPTKIYLFYMAQSGFYLHSLYALIFMDTWRKDSIIMIIHHISALTLTVFSFALRYHNIGCLVIFLHDICDIFLEFSKLNIYFKIQGDKIVKMHEWLANISFLSFTVVWCIFRLYLYPLRVLYTALSNNNGLQSVLPFSLLMNGLLWILQIINIYWFFLILQILYRVITGQSAEDTRENDEMEKLNQNGDKKLS